MKRTFEHVSYGSLSLDAVMARMHGWSEDQIDRVTNELGEIAAREHAIAHKNGRVKDCPCIECNPLEE